MTIGRIKWTDTIRTDRISIIQWLPPRDRQTGEELAERLKSWEPRKRIELFRCNNAQGVVQALELIRDDIPRKGVPILHIESHGAAGPDGGLSGRTTELLEWRRFRKPLRALNLATAFQLLVVGAACYGDGFIWSIGEIAPSPFLACVGFRSTVSESSVFNVMLEFYRGMMLRKENVEDAVESAQLEATNQASEPFRFMTVRTLLTNSLKKYFEDEAAMSNRDRFARNVRDAARMAIGSGGTMSSPFARAVAEDERATLAAAEQVVAKILAYDVLPENRQRFAVDVKKLMREAKVTKSARND